MKELIKRHYNAIIKRGFITDSTEAMEFIEKIEEESKEAKNADSEFEFVKELTDVAAVAINAITHLGYDFIFLYIENVQLQEKRANEV